MIEGTVTSMKAGNGVGARAVRKARKSPIDAVLIAAWVGGYAVVLAIFELLKVAERLFGSMRGSSEKLSRGRTGMVQE
jgi:hypothetical protein